MEQQEQLIRVGIVLEELKKKVDELSSKMDSVTLNSSQLAELNRRVVSLDTDVNRINDTHIKEIDIKLAVSEEKVRRLEGVVYGAIVMVVAELLGLIGLWIGK